MSFIDFVQCLIRKLSENTSCLIPFQRPGSIVCCIHTVVSTIMVHGSDGSSRWGFDVQTVG